MALVMFVCFYAESVNFTYKGMLFFNKMLLNHSLNHMLCLNARLLVKFMLELSS